MDRVLENIHSMISTGLSPGQSAVEHATPSLGRCPAAFHPRCQVDDLSVHASRFWLAVLVSQTQTLETLGAEGGLQLSSSMESGLSFDLRATALQAISRQSLLPNETISIKKVDWARNRWVC